VRNDNYFKDLFYIPSTRLKNWDYSTPGYYFVTICTREKKCNLSNIVDNKTVLSPIGKIIEEEIHKTKIIRKNISFDSYIIMPNHVHIIIFICPTVETHCNASLQIIQKTLTVNIFGPQKNNLGSVVRGIKSSVIRRCIKEKIYFHWQPRFYDHIIRSETSLTKIREYIRLNPFKWNDDMENPINKSS